MRILLFGGTAWLGRTIAQAAIKANHDLTCVARGSSVPAAAQLVQLDRDLDRSLSALPAGRWDAVIDLATQPGHVRRAVDQLRERADHYLFISSGNAYASLSDPGITEEAPLCRPLTADSMTAPHDYGPAKVACEEAVLSAFGPDRTTIIRPGLIGGPEDPTGRSTYWPLRFARPSNRQGRVLVPGALDYPTSVIDVRDLADWIVQLAEVRGGGIFNATGEVTSLGNHLQLAQTVAKSEGKMIAADPDWLTAQGVNEWMGPKSLPLWISDPQMRGMGALSNLHTLENGLSLRPLRDTLAETLAWAVEANLPTVAGAGLTDREEQALLTALDAQG